MKSMKSKQITVKLIRSLNPCTSRLENFLTYYPRFSGDIIDFLSLDYITPLDKIWVAIRVLPRRVLEVFAVDCAFAAYADAAVTAAASYAAVASYAAAASYAAVAADAADAADAAAASYAAVAADADAADAASYAADTAAVAAAVAAERERQVDALIYLCGGA